MYFKKYIIFPICSCRRDLLIGPTLATNMELNANMVYMRHILN